MPRVRRAAVAGTFYPAEAGDLRAQIDDMLAGAAGASDTTGVASARPAALIAPHAGYMYSGPIAATAFATLEHAAGTVDRVVLVGPSHFVPFRGVALPEAEVIETPLGQVPIDADGCQCISRLPQVLAAAEPHRREHALEVEIPFLQTVLDDFAVVPLVTGDATPEEVAEVLEELWDERTLVVVSSDLSHYHDYETARRLDRATAAAIVEKRPQDLAAGSACGRLAIQGLLGAVSSRGADVSLLDLRSSGDTAGPRDQVVGYGAFRVA